MGNKTGKTSEKKERKKDFDYKIAHRRFLVLSKPPIENDHNS